MASKITTNGEQKIWENSSRIAVLETVFADMKQDISDIRNNHLVHIQASMDSLDKKFPVLANDVATIKKFVYGAISVILLAVAGAVVRLVFRV